MLIATANIHDASSPCIPMELAFGAFGGLFTFLEYGGCLVVVASRYWLGGVVNGALL
jgi:hypothetical protein